MQLIEKWLILHQKSSEYSILELIFDQKNIITWHGLFFPYHRSFNHCCVNTDGVKFNYPLHKGNCTSQSADGLPDHFL